MTLSFSFIVQWLGYRVCEEEEMETKKEEVETKKEEAVAQTQAQVNPDGDDPNQYGGITT